MFLNSDHFLILDRRFECLGCSKRAAAVIDVWEGGLLQESVARRRNNKFESGKSDNIVFFVGLELVTPAIKNSFRSRGYN